MINENQNIINRKVVMLQKGYNLPKLAKEVGHTKQAVSQSIQGRSTSLRIHKTIAGILGVSLVEFWPELYGPVPVVNTSSHDVKVNDPAGAVN